MPSEGVLWRGTRRVNSITLIFSLIMLRVPQHDKEFSLYMLYFDKLGAGLASA